MVSMELQPRSLQLKPSQGRQVARILGRSFHRNLPHLLTNAGMIVPQAEKNPELQPFTQTERISMMRNALAKEFVVATIGTQALVKLLENYTDEEFEALMIKNEWLTELVTLFERTR